MGANRPLLDRHSSPKRSVRRLMTDGRFGGGGGARFGGTYFEGTARIWGVSLGGHRGGSFRCNQEGNRCHTIKLVEEMDHPSSLLMMWVDQSLANPLSYSEGRFLAKRTPWDAHETCCNSPAQPEELDAVVVKQFTTILGYWC